MVVTMKVSEETDGAGIVDRFLSEIQARIVPFTREHVSIFFDAFRRYRNGRHPARMNMGDCFTYATAKAAGMPLLFIGDGFGLTDLPPA
jgi:ribonuclease VapC